MGVVTNFLTEIGLWPAPRLPPETIERAEILIETARHEAEQLAGDLNSMADGDDPFASFASRARKSRF